MYSGYRVNGRISDRAEIRTPNFVLVLGLFLFYFSLFIGSPRSGAADSGGGAGWAAAPPGKI